MLHQSIRQLNKAFWYFIIPYSSKRNIQKMSTLTVNLFILKHIIIKILQKNPVSVIIPRYFSNKSKTPDIYLPLKCNIYHWKKKQTEVHVWIEIMLHVVVWYCSLYIVNKMKDIILCLVHETKPGNHLLHLLVDF